MYIYTLLLIYALQIQNTLTELTSNIILMLAMHTEVQVNNIIKFIILFFKCSFLIVSTFYSLGKTARRNISHIQ